MEMVEIDHHECEIRTPRSDGMPLATTSFRQGDLPSGVASFHPWSNASRFGKIRKIRFEVRSPFADAWEFMRIRFSAKIYLNLVLFITRFQSCDLGGDSGFKWDSWMNQSIPLQSLLRMI
jgi:hypothetical protein